MSDDVKLTPTEDLLVEVLIARHRLGEPFWPFDYCQRPTLKRLEAKGLVTHEPASTPHLRARLTPRARDLFMSRSHVPTGAKVEWAVRTADDSRPIHYAVRSHSPAASEKYHREYAARHDGDLFKRAVVEMPWQLVPEEKT